MVNLLASCIDNSTKVHYDHYEKITGESADHLKLWLDQGADFNKLIIPGLSDDLGRLKHGERIVDPLTREDIYPGKYIIFEMPLGKEHEDTSKYIDWLIWVDIPFDLALARKLKEFTTLFLAEKNNLFNRLLWLDNFLENYIEIIREVLEIQREKVSAHADIILDGKKDLGILITEAKEAIIKYFP